MIISMPSSFFVPITYSIELITDEEIKEDLDECLEDALRDYEIANSEYVMISSFVENIYGYVSDKNIRVIYTFSN